MQQRSRCLTCAPRHCILLAFLGGEFQNHRSVEVPSYRLAILLTDSKQARNHPSTTSQQDCSLRARIAQLSVPSGPSIQSFPLHSHPICRNKQCFFPSTPSRTDRFLVKLSGCSDRKRMRDWEDGDPVGTQQEHVQSACQEFEVRQVGMGMFFR